MYIFTIYKLLLNSLGHSTDKLFAAGWLAYGHAFAAEGENDQAMSTYFTASRLLKGCHLPLLYIGLQYGSTNNPLLAEKFFQVGPLLLIMTI